MRPLLASSLVLLAAVWATALPAEDVLVLRAGELHTGTGQVLSDVVVVLRGGKIEQIGGTAPAGYEPRRVPAVIPGLVGAAWPAVTTGSEDPGGVAPERRAVDTWDAWSPHPELIGAGVTTLYLDPGRTRLVPGRGALVHTGGDPARGVLVPTGALHAVLGQASKDSPADYEPPLPASIENPFEVIGPGGPSTRMGEIARLREALVLAKSGRPEDPAWRLVASGSLPLRIRADAERDIRAALELADEFGVGLVIEGGAESWKLADELGSRDATVLLEIASPWRAPKAARDPGLEERQDTPGILHEAGVVVGLAPRESTDYPHLLSLAAASVRGGLPPARAIAAVTSVPAGLSGGRTTAGRITPGGRADLVALSASPLASNAAPLEVWIAGESVWKAKERGAEKLLAIRVGRVFSGTGETWSPGMIVFDGDYVVSVGPGTPPAGAQVIDLPDAVATPGFVDAFGRAGAAAAASAGPVRGSAALTAADLVGASSAGLDDVVRGGVTTVHLIPRGSGPVAGTTSIVRATREDGSPVVWADRIGVLFHVGSGPDDPGSRARALHSMKSFLDRAAGYHGKWEQWENRDKKKGKDAGKDKGKSRSKKTRGPDKKPKQPDRDLDMDAMRAVFQGKLKALVRVGRADTILEALQIFGEKKIQPVLVGGEEAHLVADRIAGKVSGVILGPEVLSWEDGDWQNRPAILHAAGVPVVFGSFGSSSAEGLGLAAALAVRHGLDAGAALESLTGGAGRVLGFDEFPRVGTLRPGAPADIVVFSADPLEATSRIVLVVAGGEIVHGSAGGVGGGS